MKRLDENPAERRAFDMGAELYGGALPWVATMLANWATIERIQHPGGTFGEQLAILANEVAAAAEAARKVHQ